MDTLKKAAWSATSIASLAMGAAALAPSASAASPSVSGPLGSYHAVGTCHGSLKGHTYDAAALGWYPDASYENATSTRITFIHMQANLCNDGYALAIDGYKGSATTNALKSFQSKHHLTADGVLGAQTAQALFGINPFKYNLHVSQVVVNPTK